MIRPWFNSQVCGLLIVIIHFLDCVSTVAISVSFRIFTCYRYSSRMGKYYPCERGRRGESAGGSLFLAKIVLTVWLCRTVRVSWLFTAGRSDSGGFRGEQHFAVPFIGVDFQTSKLHLRKAILGRFHPLFPVNLDADFVQAVRRNGHFIAIPGDFIRPFPILVLVCGQDIHQQFLCPEGGGVDSQIPNCGYS